VKSPSGLSRIEGEQGGGTQERERTENVILSKAGRGGRMPSDRNAGGGGGNRPAEGPT